MKSVITAKEKIEVEKKVAMIRLARKTGKVSEACRKYGYSRDSYYRIKKLYEQGGEMALLHQRKNRPLPKNRNSPELDTLVLRRTVENPLISKYTLSKLGQAIKPNFSVGGVQSIWKRYGIETQIKRIIFAAIKREEAFKIDSSDWKDRAIKKLTTNRKELRKLLMGAFYPGNNITYHQIAANPPEVVDPIVFGIAIDTFSRLAAATCVQLPQHKINEAVNVLREKSYQRLRTTLIDVGADTNHVTFDQQHQPHLTGIILEISNTKDQATNRNRNMLSIYDHRRQQAKLAAKSTTREETVRLAFEQHFMEEFLERTDFSFGPHNTGNVERKLSDWISYYNEEHLWPGYPCYCTTPLDAFIANGKITINGTANVEEFLKQIGLNSRTWIK